MSELVTDKKEEKVTVKTILNAPGVKLWAKSFLQNDVPFFIINRNLHIIWVNPRFSNFFGPLKDFFGMRIDKFYSDSLPRERLRVLYHDIHSPKRSWQGKVERRGANKRRIISNLLLCPLFKSPEEVREPVAYACILDNIGEEYRKMLKYTFKSLLEASRLKDNDSEGHNERVNRYAKTISESLLGNPHYQEVDLTYIEDIGDLAAMHDVGKIGTPDDILNKSKPLEDWEWKILKEHTINGAYILSTFPNLLAKEIALYHHERWEGSGYPYGLSHEMIPLSARIVAIADVYDALRMNRKYREILPHREAKVVILNGRGTQFDPALVDCFIKVEKKFDTIYEELKD
jgi:HD-GYP domain-containing protein (c-di-GMP phosphodiesterase class II)